MLKFSFLFVLLVLWAGLILGVSFIATPVKFMAPHLTMSVALEIGRATFHVFNKIEWGICLAVILLTANIYGNSIKWFIVGGLVSLLLLETFWLLPALDIRAIQIISGEAGNPGILHLFYIIADILKIAIALIGGYWILYEVQT
jgi:hypothetical protein